MQENYYYNNINTSYSEIQEKETNNPGLFFKKILDRLEPFSPFLMCENDVAAEKNE